MDSLSEYASGDSESLMKLLRRLRAPGGCPWDQKQTRHTLSRCLRGECAELIEALDSEQRDAILDELGDVLMNVFLQVVIAEEKGEFTLKDVFNHVIAKMIRRHEHVFGTASASTPEEVLALWNKVKLKEHGGKERKSQMDDVQQSLSALDRAEKLQQRAAKVGFDWSDASGAAAKLFEECGELQNALRSGNDASIDEELGDLLFSAVNLCRKREKDTAEEILRRANYKFERRFRALENALAASGKTPESANAEELDAVWNQVKQEEK